MSMPDLQGVLGCLNEGANCLEQPSSHSGAAWPASRNTYSLVYGELVLNWFLPVVREGVDRLG
jgi:hypothetical protein